MKQQTKEDKLLNILEKSPHISTARISFYLKSNYILTLSLLEELLKKNKVRRIQHTKGVYWELK